MIVVGSIAPTPCCGKGWGTPRKGDRTHLSDMVRTADPTTIWCAGVGSALRTIYAAYGWAGEISRLAL